MKRATLLLFAVYAFTGTLHAQVPFGGHSGPTPAPGRTPTPTPTPTPIPDTISAPTSTIAPAPTSTTAAPTHTSTPTPALTPAPSDLVQMDAATPGQVHEYIALTHAEENARRMFSQTMETARTTSAPYLPQVFWDDLKSTLDKLDLEATLVPAYQKYFSQQDMQQVLAFYKTPAGQHLLEAQSRITSAVTDQLQQQVNVIGREVARRHAAEIATAKKKYDEAPAPTPQDLVPKQ